MQFKDNFEIPAIYENARLPNYDGLTIHYGFESSDYGPILVAKTARGLCWLALGADRTVLFQKMKRNWRGARFVQIDMRDVFGGSAALDLFGTPFQLQVWKALLDVPCGKTVSYQDIAQAIRKPRAVRAVGTAIGSNPISVLVPCHRVIRRDGGIGGYAWGVDIKREILRAEAA